MKRKFEGVAIAFAIIGSGCAASITARVDFDKQAKFDSYKTFAWYKTSTTSLEASNPLIHQRIVTIIQDKLQENGELVAAEQNPDLLVTYHTTSKEETQINSSSMGYGYGAGWGWDPYWGGGGMGPGMGGSTTTTVSTYTKGTLIIDILDAAKKELIWRGTVESVFSENPQTAEKEIYKAVEKLAKVWEKEYHRSQK